MKVGISKENKVTAWLHRSVFPSIAGTASPQVNEPTGDELSLGMMDMPYAIPNVRCETQIAPTKTRIGWLRSVCNIQHAFAVGTMVDEIAHARGLDAVENLLELLGEDRTIDLKALAQEAGNYGTKQEEYPWETSRMKNVLKIAKEKSNWGKTMPRGSAQGIAIHRSFLTYVACVVEVSVDDRNRIRIPKVDYVVDCGVAVNPERIRSQFEGGASFATSIALKSEITISHGATVESNFHEYLLARMPDAPLETAVHIVDSTAPPTGVGEPPIPPFAPALCNALFAATGKRIRQLPVRLT
jgi:isoquinoline 1-oxidoreductase beta subunit